MMSAPVLADAAEKNADSHGAKANETLVLRHAKLVKRIAHDFLRRMPPHVDVNDLIQAGMVGLLEAVQRYDGRENASFETFATFRIRGAILDLSRKDDWTPRSLRRRLRDVARAKLQIELKTGAAPKARKIAEALGIPLEAYYRTMQDQDLSIQLRLDEPARLGAEGASSEPVDQRAGPPEELEHQQALLAIMAEIETLPEFERALLHLYYDKEFPMREIGVILSLSESRICQIHKQTMRRLRAAIRTESDPLYTLAAATARRCQRIT
jgi:RNA polymerase sigma factor for flagellar operon FliA